MIFRYTLLVTASLFFLTGCQLFNSSETPLFEQLPPAQTGVTFVNAIKSNDSLNVQTFPFLYNGGGVAIGDINNDGLSELYFTGNMVSSKLYLNKGNLQFEDITESAGVQTDQWATGVSMVDINNDSFLDIYVTIAVPEIFKSNRKGANLLFLNNGDNTFKESAADYKINDTGFTTHAAFFDYNLDGHLDLYLLNNSPADFARNEVARDPSILRGQSSISYDELYKNNGDGSYTKVTEEAGILKEIGFGLGVAVSDINQDGWPDIYVSNDILPNDVLYVNNRDGTFSDKTDTHLKHTSFAGMGVDIADFNNDSWPDILQVDMMPENYADRKRISGATTHEHFKEMREKGFHYQYNYNTLQLGNGVNSKGDVIFSEIARLAEIAHTNWSWSALFGDYDNDGHKDIMITNGYPKAVNDYDYLTDLNNAGQFGLREIVKEKELEILKNVHSYEVPNYIFRNEGDLTFSDKSSDWAFDEAGFSYGASQADLDNDGDLDIVISNINTTPFIYRNQSDTLRANHWLTVKLLGPAQNRGGIGSKLTVTAGSESQHQYYSPYRGYQSTMDNKLLFGLGEYDSVDSLKIVWPDGRYQIVKDLKADQTITLNYEDAEDSENFATSDKTESLPISNVTAKSGLEYKHDENNYADYNDQSLLPYQLSKLGPAIASGDVNGDELDDIYIGGAAGQAGALFVQQDNGSFKKSDQAKVWSADKEYEDIDAVFFDANGNGRLDLYVASGGYEFTPASDGLQDRLYINSGAKGFVKDVTALPRMLTSSSSVTAGDYDDDGDLDLFVGGRVVPMKYPYAARSYILRNNGGSFTDVTSDIAPELEEPGLITDAVWSDFDGDGNLDLVTTGEWLPVQFYRNKNGKFEDVTESLGLDSYTGWWYSIEQGDFDNDGDPDFLAGNLGLNYSYKTSEDHRFELFADDFDNNQSVDLLFSIEKDGEHIPYYGRAKFQTGIPDIKKLFQRYESYAEADVEDIIGTGGMRDARHYQAATFENSYIENNGEDGFKMTALPNEAQFSSVQDFVPVDINDDGNLDLMLAGNMYESEPETPRNDAGNGLLLTGNGKGGFEAVSPFKSGFLAPLNVKDLEMIKTRNGLKVVVANNDDSLQVFSINNKPDFLTE